MAQQRPADEIPDEIPRHGGDGRPKIWPPGVKPGAVGEAGEFYTRASKLGECLEDAWAIHRSHTRKVVFGFGRSEGLYDLAQAVASLDERDKLDEIVTAAARMGGDLAQAMSGTALHLLSEQADAGDRLRHLAPRMRAAVDAWRRLMGSFEIHGTEQFVVHDALKAAGSYDRLVSPLGLMRAPDGTVIGPSERIGVDLKSGKSAENFGPLYKVQQWVYFGEGACPYTHAAGRGSWPDEVPPRADWSLIPHVPLNNPEDAGFYWVDLEEGRRFAELALEVRVTRKAKGLASAGLPAREVEILAPAPAVQLGGNGSGHVLADHEPPCPEDRGCAVCEWGALLCTVCDEAEGGLAAVCPGPPPALAPVAQVDVVAQLRAATSRAQIDALFDLHVSVWSDFLTAVAKAQLAELGESGGEPE